MAAIVRKDIERRAEDPFKTTIFRLRKRHVPFDRIERYKKEHDISAEMIMPDACESVTFSITLLSPTADGSSNSVRHQLRNVFFAITQRAWKSCS